MKLSALQIGFGVSVCAHAVVFSVIPLFQAYHRSAGPDGAAGDSSQLEFVLLADLGEAFQSTVGADIGRLTPETPAQDSAVVNNPVVPQGPAAEPLLTVPESVPQLEEFAPHEEAPVVLVPPPTAQPLALGAPAVPNSSSSSEATASGATGIATPSASGVSVSSGAIGAAYLFNPRPQYPPQARARNQEGKVIISVLVNAEGLPEQVEVRESSGVASLDQAALEAVKSWRFTPARVQDRPISSRVEVPVNFELKYSTEIQAKP